MNKQRDISVVTVFQLVPAKMPQNMEVMLNELNAAEEQAIGLVKLFEKGTYLTPEHLESMLQSQELPAVDLRLVIGYLVGYLAGETYDSKFDKAVFGQNSIMTEKGRIVSSSLIALLNLLTAKNQTTLPNRMPKKVDKKPRISKRRELAGKK